MWPLCALWKVVQAHYQSVTRRRLGIMAILLVAAIPAWRALRDEGYPRDATGDLITLAVVAITLWGICGASVLLTDKWDVVGRALTAISALMAIAFTSGWLRVFDEDWWPKENQWAVRGLLIWWGIVFLDAIVSRIVALKRAPMFGSTVQEDVLLLAIRLRTTAVPQEEIAKVLDAIAGRLAGEGA